MSELKKIFIKPANPEHRVRKHDKPQEFLAAEGEWVVKHKFWLRRITDGSVVEAKPPKKTPEKPAPKTTGEE